MYIIALVILFTIYVALRLRVLIPTLRKLASIPGPKAASFIGNTDFIAIERDTLFRLGVSDSFKYFPVYKYQVLHWPIVQTLCPDHIEAIISKTKHLAKSHIYQLLNPWLETGLLISTDEKWKNRRRILTPTFHFNILQQFVSTFLEHSTKLCNELDGLVDQSVDVIPIMSKHALHIICETAMGTNFEGQESNKYRNAIHAVGELVVERMVRPWLYPFMFFILSPICYKTLMLTKYLRNYTSKLIKAREENFDITQIPETENDVYKSKKRLAMLDMMLHAKMTGADIDDNGIREEVNTFLFEGHDTTSNCVSFTLFLLANNPDIQKRVLEELKDILTEGQESINYDSLNNMSYLDRVIKESLRLYPSVPIIGRIISEEMTLPSGHVLPEGTNVLIRIYEMHRHPKFYSDPDKFDPDRFLPENIRQRHPYSYIPFSAGPRNCIGQKFALLEIKTILASVLTRFELFPVDTPDTVVLLSDIVLRAKDGLRMMFRRRDIIIKSSGV